jgi:hypothetical protein
VDKEAGERLKNAQQFFVVTAINRREYGVILCGDQVSRSPCQGKKGPKKNSKSGKIAVKHCRPKEKGINPFELTP